MGIYGRWFAATEAEAKELWSIEEGGTAINPFTREMAKVERVVLDHEAIESRPNVYAKFLLAHHVAALFRLDDRLPSALPPIEHSETELVYVPREALVRFFERNDTNGPFATTWRARIESQRTRESLRAYDEAIANEALAKELVELARAALARGATLFGTFE